MCFAEILHAVDASEIRLSSVEIDKNSVDYGTFTPLKINMEHNHGGSVQMIFLSKWVICRFQPLIFQGVPYQPVRDFCFQPYHVTDW